MLSNGSKFFFVIEAILSSEANHSICFRHRLSKSLHILLERQFYLILLESKVKFYLTVMKHVTHPVHVIIYGRIKDKHDDDPFL